MSQNYNGFSKCNSKRFFCCPPVFLPEPLVLADLSVVKTDSPDPIMVGQDLTYTVTVTNNGPSAATGVTLKDVLPSSVTFVSASPGCILSNGVVNCSIGTLLVGSSVAITIVVQPNVAEIITNTVFVIGNELDPNPFNNTDTETTTVRIGQLLAPAGGFFGVNTALTDAYACAQNSWSPRATLPESREGYAGGLLPDGRIIISHGEIEGIGDTDTVLLYNPILDIWSIGPVAPIINAELMGAVLDGKYYVVGGRDDFTSVQIFDPIINSWSLGPRLPTGRAGLAVVVLNGLLHAIGGRTGTTPRSGTALATHEVFDPNTNTWTTRAPLPLARMDIYSTTVFNGKIYVIGGFDTITVNTVFIYEPTTDSWTSGVPMPTARSNAAAGVCGNEIFVMGGVLEGEFTPITTAEAYNPVTNSWRTNVAPMPVGRAEFNVIPFI
ncbi:Kelch repeat-containing protein [Bacillus sp. GeD10]|uniref:Kelch repeat-containing protein n=1 Tax=Bacillus sp. GeD10 TaxID=1301086 RepID=UPI0002D23003|nr:kelch repeat-containing protein [Bacillus sp. GeD10]CCW06209.1 diablo [Bacillus sp. GeD10]